MKIIKLLFFILLIFYSFISINAQTQKTIDSLRHVIKTAKHDTTRINAYSAWGEQIYMQLPDSAIALWKISETIANKLLATNPPANVADTAKKQLASVLNNIGYIYQMQGDIPKALEYYNKSLNIQEEIVAKKGMATSFNNIGSIYDNQGDIPKALEYYNKSLNIQEEIGDKRGMARSFNNIGYIYYNQARAVESKRKSRQSACGGGSDSLIKKVYPVERDSLFNRALEYYNKSLNIQEEIGDKKGMATSFNNIGIIYDNQGDIPKALEYYNKSLNIKEEIGDKQGMAYSFNNIGSIYFENNNIAHAKSYIEKGYKLSKELGYPENIELCASWLKKIYIKQGNYQLAYEFYQEEVLMHDSIQNEENYKQTQKQQAKYEYEKQAAVDSIAHSKAIYIKDLQVAKIEEEKKKQRVVIYSFIAGFIIILIFSIIIFRLFMQKKKTNRIVAKKNQSLEIAFTEINAQKKEITDSINYAKRIQQAVLPNFDTLLNTSNQYKVNSNKLKTDETDHRLPITDHRLLITDYFVLFKPKDIVSGDFYWASRANEWLIVTVADCTGHGVPGAFMSMLGVSFLNEIVRKKEVTKASDVLNNLRNSIIEALQQNGTSGEQNTSACLDFARQPSLSVKDGMDIVFCVLNTQTNILQYAGANNPLWIVSNNKTQTPQIAMEENNQCESVQTASFRQVGTGTAFHLKEVKADKMPVAIYKNMTPFTNHVINLQKGDTIYLCSDGYVDQFGGEKNKKFMSKKLKELFVCISEKSMTEQREILDSTFKNWKGNHDQIDDVTILGLKI